MMTVLSCVVSFLLSYGWASICVDYHVPDNIYWIGIGSIVASLALNFVMGMESAYENFKR